MKRFMSTILTAVFFTVLSVVPAFAADPAIEVSTAEASPGDSVTLTFTISDNPGIAAYSADLIYDQSALKLTGASSGQDMRILTFIKYVPNNRVAAFGARNATSNGTMFTATFQVLDGAKEGLAPVTLSVTEMVSANYVYYTPDITSGGVTVLPGSTENTEAPAPTDAPDASDVPADPEQSVPPVEIEPGELEDILNEDFFNGEGMDIDVEDVLDALGIEKDTSLPTDVGGVRAGAEALGPIESPPLEEGELLTEDSAADPANADAATSDASPALWIVLGVVVVAGAAAGVYIIIKKKKQSTPEQKE